MPLPSEKRRINSTRPSGRAFAQMTTVHVGRFLLVAHAGAMIATAFDGSADAARDPLGDYTGTVNRRLTIGTRSGHDSCGAIASVAGADRCISTNSVAFRQATVLSALWPEGGLICGYAHADDRAWNRL